MSEKADHVLVTKLKDIKEKIIRLSDPEGIAFRCGLDILSESGKIMFKGKYFNEEILIGYPELTAHSQNISHKFDVSIQIIIMLYLLTASGDPLEFSWVSFADLPSGRFYGTAFQGYTGDKLVKTIDKNEQKYLRAASELEGLTIPIGDLSYEFKALPRIPLAVIFWRGDEDFNSSCKILFDSSACHYLPIDACAVLGSQMTSKIIKLL